GYSCGARGRPAQNSRRCAHHAGPHHVGSRGAARSGTCCRDATVPVVDHRLVAELDSRGVAFELGCASTAALLRTALRLAPADAKGRVSAAADLGPRRAVSGEALPPLFACVAAAQVEGTIS